jgi:FkbM family methyltransferase
MNDIINLTDPTLAATLEIHYLRETLRALRDERDSAVDVGAHRGDVTAALIDLGYRVMAVEPQPALARRLAERFRSLLDLDLLHIERCAASNRRGVGTLILGSASTVSTLERDWTSVAFPEEFRAPERMDVPLHPIAELALAAGFARPAFVKVDVEGHELPALQGLLQEAISNDPPPLIMFEANQRFPDAARECLALLGAHGYNRFDIFIREGIAPIAAERFSGAQLPAAWLACNERYFYANVIAYHGSVDARVIPPSPVLFVESYQLEAARDLLRRGMRLEEPQPIPVHPIWSTAREELRQYLFGFEWRDFLSHPVCKNMFFRGRWGAGQDKELAALSATEFGSTLLETHRDPQAGFPRLSEKLPGLSTNMLGMLYYLARVREQCDDALPDRIIEVGGGYGAFACAYMKQHPAASYVIVDLPEMLAIQHYFLTLALPGRRIVFGGGIDARPEPGQVLLVPASRIGQTPLDCELLFSTFGFSELPRELQKRIEKTEYFGASRIFLAGQFASEFPHLNLVHHDEVIGAARQRFSKVHVEPFHAGKNYLLIGSRSAA